MPDEELLPPGDFYDTMAPHYDSFIEQTRLGYLSLEEEAAFVESVIGDSRVVLDLGCGTGRTARLLGGPGRALVGIAVWRQQQWAAFGRVASGHIRACACFLETVELGLQKGASLDTGNIRQALAG